MRAFGTRQARRWLLSGEPFDADGALRLGLVHQVVGPRDLDRAVEHQIEELLAGGVKAVSDCKRLLAELTPRGESLAGVLAESRTSPEAREGVAAFLDKRAPAWLRR